MPWYLLARHGPWHMTAATVEALAQTVWFYVTPATLCLAALILGIRLVWGKKYKQRMSRASFLVILSFAALMVRLVFHLSPLTGEPPTAPDAAWAVFYTVSASYFAYALVREWALPFVWWTYRRLRHGDTKEALPEEFRGITDA